MSFRRGWSICWSLRLPSFLASPGQALFLPVVISVATLFLYRVSAYAQGSEAVAKVAEAVTVRVEGATQGSGILVRREGERYIVLTAWHVVSGQRSGEEVDVYTSDGRRHQVELESIRRIDSVDIAILSFSSKISYSVARLDSVNTVKAGSPIYVSGFPLPTSTVSKRLWRLLGGQLVANVADDAPNGYRLFYSNPTLPGMSGGAVLNSSGGVIGVHAGAERSDQVSDITGKNVATGVNIAVPVEYYFRYFEEGRGGSLKGSVERSAPATPPSGTGTRPGLVQGCHFLEPAGGSGGSPIVTKTVGFGSGLGQSSLNTYFYAAKPYISYKYFYTSNSSASTDFQGRLKFTDGSSLEVINETHALQMGTGRQWNVQAVPGKTVSQVNFKIGASADQAATGFTYRISVQGCN
jgi:S1-C subfamily serine protease